MGRKRSVDKVKDFLHSHGVATHFVELDVSTRTAEEAAAALGVVLDHVVKTIVFLADGEPVLALVPGSRRVNEKLLAQVCHAQTVERAHPDVAREATGFPVGGIPPFAHPAPIRTIVDDSLLSVHQVYMGAGSPTSMLAIDTMTLLELTNAITAAIAS